MNSVRGSELLARIGNLSRAGMFEGWREADCVQGRVVMVRPPRDGEGYQVFLYEDDVAHWNGAMAEAKELTVEQAVQVFKLAVKTGKIEKCWCCERVGLDLISIGFVKEKICKGCDDRIERGSLGIK